MHWGYAIFQFCYVTQILSNMLVWFLLGSLIYLRSNNLLMEVTLIKIT